MQTVDLEIQSVNYCDSVNKAYQIAWTYPSLFLSIDSPLYKRLKTVLKTICPAITTEECFPKASILCPISPHITIQLFSTYIRIRRWDYKHCATVQNHPLEMINEINIGKIAVNAVDESINTGQYVSAKGHKCVKGLLYKDLTISNGILKIEAHGLAFKISPKCRELKWPTKPANAQFVLQALAKGQQALMLDVSLNNELIGGAEINMFIRSKFRENLFCWLQLLPPIVTAATLIYQLFR